MAIQTRENTPLKERNHSNPFGHSKFNKPFPCKYTSAFHTETYYNLQAPTDMVGYSKALYSIFKVHSDYHCSSVHNTN